MLETLATVNSHYDDVCAPSFSSFLLGPPGPFESLRVRAGRMFKPAEWDPHSGYGRKRRQLHVGYDAISPRWSP